jgi:hypothetical protein
MTYTLARVSHTDKGTFGVLLSPDGVPLCLTLEDPWRDNKRNVSCIPAGIYDVAPHNGVKYKDVWALQNVPDRTAILIHAGNTINNTQGCILVGRSYGQLGDLPAVLESQRTIDMLRGVLPQRFKLYVKGNI